MKVVCEIVVAVVLRALPKRLGMLPVQYLAMNPSKAVVLWTLRGPRMRLLQTASVFWLSLSVLTAILAGCSLCTSVCDSDLVSRLH